MLKDIRLYIAGQQVEFDKTPDILITYQSVDYTNPTVKKNSYSKTITIDGTQKNNNIFNHIWQLDRVMDTNFELFNCSQRVPFELYHNAELVEKGYAKLDSINRRNGYKIEYSITLFGGLGSFFYSLAYNIDTDKEKTLADLNYTNTPNPDDEFNFEINKNTVWNAWDALRHYGHNSGSYLKWDYINFVPCYNGLPEDFDSDRVLINKHGLKDTRVRYTQNGRIVNSTFPNSISDSDNTYHAKNGFVTGQMMRECDEWEMRDLRSYLQRPALSVRGFFDAVRDPQNNGGYNVQLDPDFFSDENPYYKKAWITLPMLEPETDAVDEYHEWEWAKDAQYNYGIAPYTGNNTHNLWKLINITPVVGIPDAYSMDVEIHATITGTTAETLYTSMRWMTQEYDPVEDETVWRYNNYLGCMCVQLYGFGEGTPWWGKKAKCGSNIVILTTNVGGEYIGTRSINEYYEKKYNEADCQYNFGYWRKVSGSDYVWHNETDNTDIVHFYMDTNLMSEIPNIGISFGNLMTLEGALSPSRCGWVFDITEMPVYGSHITDHYFKYWDKVRLVNLDSDTINKVNGKMRSFQPVRKKDLLGGLEGTPCDWLLSYCKLFGLFIEKDKFSNTIYIKLRNNWYKDEVVDLEKLIDRGQKMDISPLTFESKWYNFNYKEAEGKFLDRYKTDYSQDFGKQLIDTKYNFNAEEVNLLEDTKFRNGLTSLEKSNYFNNKTDINGNQIPQCLFNWCTVTYYKDADTLDTEMCLPQQTTITELNPNAPKTFSDALPKLQMKDSDRGACDGDGVLVFFQGLRDTGVADYWLSDDIDEMFIDSDSPCWLQTRHEWNEQWTERIAIRTNSIPEFSRYITHNGVITASWDFGYTKELFVPYYRYDVNRTPTMYENFWKSYIQDLYSVNTRNVDCYVALDSNNVYDFMKRFYWWDNCYWVCTKVQDFNVAADKATLCSFTKVNNKEAYLEQPTFDDYFFNFYRTDGGALIPSQGTDEERSVYFNLDSSSNWTVIDAGVGYSEFDPNYPTSGGYVIGQEIKATFMPNFNMNPRPCTYVAGNAEGNAIYITVIQDGYQKEKYLTVDPTSIVLPKELTSSAVVTLTSSSDWTVRSGALMGAANFAWFNQVTGHSGTTNLYLSATTNTTTGERTLQFTFNNNDGLSTTMTVKQKGLANVTLEQNEIFPVTTMVASGGNVFYKLVSDIECSIQPQGNTGGFCIASGQVSYNTTIQPTSGLSFWFHFNPNISTVSRNAVFYAYYIEDGGRYCVYPTKVPLPITQAAANNNVVNKNSAGQGVSTQLGGAGMRWTATRSGRWITLTTASGSSSDTTIQYTITNNTGNLRTGYIYVTYMDENDYPCSEVIEINQEGDGTGGGIVVQPTAITVSDKGGTYIISVSSSTSYAVTMSEAWATVDMVSKNGSFTVKVDENKGLEREMNINVTSNGQTATVHITQLSKYPNGYVLRYIPENIVFDSSGGTKSVTIESETDWNITEGTNIN